MIESKDQKITCEVLLTALRRNWRLSGAGKDAEMKEKELRLANPGSNANGKKCFLCGSTEHMKYQCPKYKETKGLSVPIPDAQLMDTRRKIVGKTLRMPTKGDLVGYLGSRNLMVKLRVDRSRYF